MKTWVSRLVLFAIVCLVPTGTWAQSTTTGSIAGVVKDTTGAVLPGVTVEVSSSALIERTRSVVTNGEGQYRVVDLPPGTYTATYTLQSFTTVTRTGIELTTGFTATVNVELKVGSVGETITVSGASPVVDTQNVLQQTVLSREVLDTIPIEKNPQAFAAVTLGAFVPGNRQDVGGSTGEFTTAVALHGISGNDATMTLDGYRVDAMIGNGAGGSRWYKPNQLIAQEITLQTGAISAQGETGGYVVNVISKPGSNSFHFTSIDNYTGTGLQSNNLTSALQAAGLPGAPKEKKIYDVGFAFGGYIVKDRLWFNTAVRSWETDEQESGNFYNLTPQTPFYTPDTSRPGVFFNYVRDGSGNVTWQATSKQKISAFYSDQNACACTYGIQGATRSAEAGLDIHYNGVHYASASWTYPVTNKLLLEAGVMYLANEHDLLPVSPATMNSHAITNLATGLAYGAYEAPLNSFTAYTARPDGTDIPNISSQFNTSYAVSYVTGSQAFKFGLTTRTGYVRNSGWQNTSYQFLNQTPVSLTLYASPQLSEENVRLNLGAYAQDQWTVQRLTMNLGLRFDHLNAYNPAQTRPGGAWVGPLVIAEQDNVPNWNDISPRAGIVYDVFGNGRTAIKASLGRYVQLEATSIAIGSNPANAMVTSTSRTWNDANGNYVPDCNLLNPLANGECGPDANSLFGTVNVVNHYPNSVLTGWGVRPYNWQFNTALQQQLSDRTALNVSYYHTWYGNLFITDNQAVSGSNYSPFCITEPSDSRLPGGGGNQLCGLYDVVPSKVGQVNNLITHASDIGGESQKFDGIDIALTARLAKGVQLAGGLSTGQAVVDACSIAQANPQVTATLAVAAGSATTGPSQSTQFCRQRLPFAGMTQVKLSGSYLLPFGGIQAAGTLQSLPGVPLSASYVATNAQIAPSLGRNLSACGSAATCNGTVTVPNLFAPYTQFGDRLNQVDARLAKTFVIGKLHLTGQFDVYNVFNVSTVLSYNTRYGASWLTPLSILPARLFKFGARIEF